MGTEEAVDGQLHLETKSRVSAPRGDTRDQSVEAPKGKVPTPAEIRAGRRELNQLHKASKGEFRGLPNM